MVAAGAWFLLKPRRHARPAKLKPMAAGLYIRDHPSASQPFIDHVFVEIGWDQLEPSRGNFTGPGWQQIDSLITKYPAVKLRLRIEAGGSAPTWLNAVSGQCITVTSQHSGKTACVPRFWQDSYLAEYHTLMQAIAHRYDNTPQVLDVVDSACTTFTAEPFILGGRDTGAKLYAAGLTKAGFAHCLDSSMAAHAELFQHTRVSLATHQNWQVATASGVEHDWPSERDLLQKYRRLYGAKVLYQNNGLADQTCTTTPSPDTATDLYCYLKAINPPKGFQQGCGKKVAACDQASVVQHALGLGGCFIEHADWNSLGAQAESFDQRLKANCKT
jgi:hypothetical protein